MRWCLPNRTDAMMHASAHFTKVRLFGLFGNGIGTYMSVAYRETQFRSYRLILSIVCLRNGWPGAAAMKALLMPVGTPGGDTQSTVVKKSRGTLHLMSRSMYMPPILYKTRYLILYG